MEPYQPTSRRPIADLFRATAHLAVRLCVRCHIHPNLVSLSSIVAAAGAGVCFWQSGNWPWLLLPAAGLCYLRLWINMLDGMVALASGKASRLGEVFNELPDRLSDIIIFAGVAHSGLCQPLLGYWVIIAALLVAYIGTFGQALGVGRQFGGIMSKPWRMVLLHVGAWIALLVAWLGSQQKDGDLPSALSAPIWQGLTILDWTLVLILLGCLQTMWVRLRVMVIQLIQPVR